MAPRIRVVKPRRFAVSAPSAPAAPPAPSPPAAPARARAARARRHHRGGRAASDPLGARGAFRCRTAGPRSWLSAGAHVLRSTQPRGATMKPLALATILVLLAA